MDEGEKKIENEIESLKKNQQDLLKLYCEEIHYTTTFINYEYGAIPEDYDIPYQPYFASDIVKLLFAFKDHNVTITQYDLSSKKYIKYLE